MDNKEKLQVGFFGYGTRALDALMEHPLYEVKYFIAPKARLCQDVWDACEKYKGKLEFSIVNDKRELEQKFAQRKDADSWIMNASPIILDKGVLDQADVFNIHPGNLETNRGHHPHLWTVLLGEPKSQIVLYKVNEEIDLGEVVHFVEIGISPDDSSLDVLNKLEDRIPDLLDAFYEYRVNHEPGKGNVVAGTYRKMLAYKDYEIDIEKDDFIQMKRKILARAMHRGAFLQTEGKRYYVDRISLGHTDYEYGQEEQSECEMVQSLDEREKEGSCLKIEEEKQTILLTKSQQEWVRFHINAIEDGLKE
ncbi:hypothetical protein LQZ18_03910 [Lachnospiraceae bacterium ZAX-1]